LIGDNELAHFLKVDRQNNTQRDHGGYQHVDDDVLLEPTVQKGISAHR
jgi:hypothetical protein